MNIKVTKQSPVVRLAGHLAAELNSEGDGPLAWSVSLPRDVAAALGTSLSRPHLGFHLYGAKGDVVVGTRPFGVSEVGTYWFDEGVSLVASLHELDSGTSRRELALLELEDVQRLLLPLLLAAAPD